MSTYGAKPAPDPCRASWARWESASESVEVGGLVGVELAVGVGVGVGCSVGRPLGCGVAPSSTEHLTLSMRQEVGSATVALPLRR